jgi:replication factor C subunit 3/5
MENLPWIEKYRPHHLDDIVNNDENIKTFKNLIDYGNSIISMILYGPPGTGKTSFILALSRYQYGDDEYKNYTLELNASSDRGIDVIRKVLTPFVQIKSKKIKLVILDECDSMTQDAQDALKGVMDIYSIHNRFCLICNNIEKISDALKSRCLPIKFTTPTKDSIRQKLVQIIEKEKINITDEALNILTLVNKDLRQIINILQGINSLYTDNIITKDKINSYLGIPDNDDIDKIYSILIERNFQKNYKELSDLLKLSKWSIIEIINSLSQKIILDMFILPQYKKNLINDISKIESRIKKGGDTIINLAFIVSSFEVNYIGPSGP